MVCPPLIEPCASTPGTARTNRPSCSPGINVRSWASNTSCTRSGACIATNDTGNSRRGPRLSCPAKPSNMRSSLSPPKPVVRIATASTIVRQPPTSAPAGSMAGRPSRNTATSVVVPPISLTRAFWAPVNHRAPTMLAAGPERMVSIGRSLAWPADISAPSPRTTIKGADTPISAKTSSARPIKRWVMPISRAFNSAVNARFGPFNLADK